MFALVGTVVFFHMYSNESKCTQRRMHVKECLVQYSAPECTTLPIPIVLRDGGNEATCSSVCYSAPECAALPILIVKGSVRILSSVCCECTSRSVSYSTVHQSLLPFPLPSCFGMGGTKLHVLVLCTAHQSVLPFPFLSCFGTVGTKPHV